MLGGAIVAAALTATPPAGAATPPQLVFSSNRGGTFGIWGASADGSGAHVIVDGPLDEIEPTLSPDGSQVAFVRTLATTCCGPTHDLWVARTDGTGERAVASDPTVDEYAPEWSPDGREIAFSRGTQAPPAANVFVVRPDGSGARQITTGGGISNIPSWSPDGRRLVFTSNRDGKQKLWTVAADGSAVAPLTDPPSGADLTPRWSPVGDSIAFRSSRSGTFEIWVVHGDGSGLRRVTEDSHEDRFPAFTIDGTAIVYASVREPCAIAPIASARCASQLWRIDVGGTNGVPLTLPGSHADFPQLLRPPASSAGAANAAGDSSPSASAHPPSFGQPLPATGWRPALLSTGLLLVVLGWTLVTSARRRVRPGC